MALDSGTRLRPYTVTDQIGAGGMGEVYRAPDTVPMHDSGLARCLTRPGHRHARRSHVQSEVRHDEGRRCRSLDALSDGVVGRLRGVGKSGNRLRLIGSSVGRVHLRRVHRRCGLHGRLRHTHSEYDLHRRLHAESATNVHADRHWDGDRHRYGDRHRDQLHEYGGRDKRRLCRWSGCVRHPICGHGISIGRIDVRDLGGCDSTAANVCNVTLTADRTVTATFGGRSVPGTGVRDTHYLPLSLDGSGRSATIAYNAIAGGATVFGENGAVSATAIVNAAVAHPWSSGWTIKPGDFNGDGRTDLLFYNAASGAVFKAISDGAFGFTYVGTSWSAGWDIAVMNLNGDALDDVFLYNTATGQHFRGTSAGAGTGDFTYVGGAWSPNWQVHTAYLNDDGITDLFLYNVTQGTWFRALNNYRLKAVDS